MLLSCDRYARCVFYQSREINNLICDTYPFSLGINITPEDRFFREFGSDKIGSFRDSVRGISAAPINLRRRFSVVSFRSRIFSGPRYCASCMQKGNRLTEIDTYTPARQCELTTTELDNRCKRHDPTSDVNISLARPHPYPHIIVIFVLVSFFIP